MRLIRDALDAGGEVRVEVLSSFLQRKRVGTMLQILAYGLGGLFAGRPWPLQSLLFLRPGCVDHLARLVAEMKPDTVYFDGVRTGAYLPALRRRFPRLRMVCDFDDLMSRRMAHLADARQPVSLGYLTKFVPGWIARALIQPLAATTIPRYEARALRRMEEAILADANNCVLVSSVEAAALRAQCAPDVAGRVVVVPPGMPAGSDAWPQPYIHRFVFIGADSLLQNRLTIEHLVVLWERVRPPLTLHLYGRQKGDYAGTPGVVVHGFVADVAEAYAPGSVMLSPSFVSGGVKTKVLEAFAHGVAVMGTALTFEGIDADCTGLARDAAGLALLVSNPDAEVQRIAEIAHTAIAQARAAHATELLSERWRAIVWPAAAR